MGVGAGRGGGGETGNGLGGIALSRSTCHLHPSARQHRGDSPPSDKRELERVRERETDSQTDRENKE